MHLYPSLAGCSLWSTKVDYLRGRHDQSSFRVTSPRKARTRPPPIDPSTSKFHPSPPPFAASRSVDNRLARAPCQAPTATRAAIGRLPPPPLPIIPSIAPAATATPSRSTPQNFHLQPGSSIAHPAPFVSVVLAPILLSSRRPRAQDAVQWYRGMNTTLTAYTQLESLLLFQSLHAYGLEPPVFSRISELLKKNPHITTDTRFQSGRLDPDALRNFYLQILKEEIKSEQAAEIDGQNGDLKNSRKRKAPSPSLPTVQESIQHQHLIPKLVNKLYARYRSAITEQIRYDEDVFEQLQRDLQDIERGEWDDKLKEKANGKRSSSGSPNLSKNTPSRTTSSPVANTQLVDQERVSSGPVPTKTPTLDQQQRPILEPPKPVIPQNGQTQAEPIAKPTPTPSPRKNKTPADQRGTPSTPQSQAPSQPQSQSQNQPQPLAPPTQFVNQLPPNSTHNGSPYMHHSPYPEVSQQPTQPPQNLKPHPGQHLNKGQPPISSNHPGPSFQNTPIQPYGGKGIPQYGQPGMPSQYNPTPQRIPPPQPPGPHSPSLQTRYHQYPGQPYPHSQPHIGQTPSPGGIMLQPFQVSPQNPSIAHQQQQPATPQYPQVQISTPRQPQLASKSSNLTPNPSRPGVPITHQLVNQARQSVSTPTSIRTPPSAISTPRSTKTVWKSSLINFTTPPAQRPEVEPLDDVASTANTQQSPSKTKSSRKSRAKPKAKEKEAEKEQENKPDRDTEPDPKASSEQLEESVPEVETRSRPKRKAPPKRKRPGSIASSQAGGSVRERSRSQSILSHTDTVAADTESQAGHRIKEERATSVDMIEEESVATPTTSTRRRNHPTQSLQANKRKRGAREASAEELEERPSTPGLLRTVIAPRHFSRMCNPIMNDIGSHKHASTFTTAVRAKDAEGYYDIIKRPTDLKSIQKAIAAGAKAVAAAASDTPAGSPGGGGGVVELPMTLDNTPPKAIVNSGQLEKELMRMFVNAVMFNPGEGGVVEDAREMFETVQQSVSNWRNISSGRIEVEETPVPEEDAPAASKRRKL